jgi:hypothetical protein
VQWARNRKRWPRNDEDYPILALPSILPAPEQSACPQGDAAIFIPNNVWENKQEAQVPLPDPCWTLL